jgi:hypothetical protein
MYRNFKVLVKSYFLIILLYHVLGVGIFQPNISIIYNQNKPSGEVLNGYDFSAALTFIKFKNNQLLRFSIFLKY